MSAAPKSKRPPRRTPRVTVKPPVRANPEAAAKLREWIRKNLG